MLTAYRRHKDYIDATVLSIIAIIGVAISWSMLPLHIRLF